MVVQVSVVLNRTVVVSDLQLDNLCDSHPVSYTHLTLPTIYSV